MPEVKQFQTVVIGSGSGGRTVAVGLSALGREVAMIEGHHVGGDCTNVGCVPSKTLIYLVNEREGDHTPAKILATVQAKRNALRDLETEEAQHTEHLHFIRGWARFTGPKQLAVDLPDGSVQAIQADNIVIATGARPRLIDIPGLPAERRLTNESMFELADAPRHIVIVGSGVIAMEMAFAFHKLGSRVTVATRSERVLTQNIPEASEALHAALVARGISVYHKATPQSYDATTETLQIAADGAPVALEGVDKVLLAVGRVRNVDKLDLDKAGVRYDPRQGIFTDSYGQTNVPGIYAIGDVTPTSHFTHSANAQGRRVVQRIAFPILPARSPEPFYPSATFSDPEVASVGFTPQQIAARYHPSLVKRIRVDLKSIDRGYTDGVEQGFVIVEAMRLTGRILSATVVGPRASEMISFFTMAITKNISLFAIYQLVFPYPTFSEGIKKVADTFARETLPNLGSEAMSYLRYRFAAPPRRPERRSIAESQQS